MVKVRLFFMGFNIEVFVFIILGVELIEEVNWIFWVILFGRVWRI